MQFGTQIVKLTGKVSTEVDVTLSFDVQRTVAAARRIIKLYEKEGVKKEEVRIKISATWEGIQAASILQEEHGISCLITVVFSLIQAIAAAEAGVDAVAPYVGRMADWGKANGYQGDLGVDRVTEMQNYLRKFGFKTQVMAASFRSVEQVRRLAGIDLLTASPAILGAVEAETTPIVPMLTADSGKSSSIPPSNTKCTVWLMNTHPVTAREANLTEVSYINNESAFRWAFNEDVCAVEKSADAMRRFADDTQKLKDLLATML